MPRFLVFLSMISVAYAQSASESSTTVVQEDAQAIAKSVERIEVTGSHIKRIDLEGPSPVVVIDSEQFEISGNNSVEDVLRDDVNFEAVNNGGKDSREGYFRFRGQHAGNTLVMLNGMRLPKEAGSFYTGISNIPASAIGRIELLKDGGSALYGADAMSGVINFVTKEDMDGGQVSMDYRTALRGFGDQNRISASYGKAFRRGSYLISTEIRSVDGYTEADLGSTSYIEGISKNVGVSGRIKTANNQKSFGDRIDPTIYDYIEPDSQSFGAMGTVGYDITDSMQANMLVLYNRKAERNIDGPLTVRLNDGEGSSAEIYGDLYERDRVSDTMNVQAQLQKDFAASWNWKVSTGYSQQNVEEVTLSGDVDKRLLNSALKAGSLDPASQDFDDQIRQATVNPTRGVEGSTSNVRAVFSGDLTEWSSGRLAMAIGAEIENENVAFVGDDILTPPVANSSESNTASFAYQSYSAQRQVNSAFTEFSLFPTEALEISVAGRLDSYPEFGDRFNPKIAVSFRPSSHLLLRSSYSTGFKPPGLKDLYTPTHAKYDRDIKGDRIVVRNPELTFETSEHYSFGAAVQAKSLSFSVDQWNWDGRGAISNFTGKHFKRYTDMGILDQFAGMGATRLEDSATGSKRIQVPVIYNRHRKILRGVDLGVKLDRRLGGSGNRMSLNAETAFSHIFERRQKAVADQPWQIDDPYGSQNLTAVSLSSGKRFYRLAARTLLNGGREEINQTNPYTELDATFAYTSSWSGKFTVGVKNLLNSAPAYEKDEDGEYFGSVTSLYSPLRRQAYLGYSQDF